MKRFAALLLVLLCAAALAEGEYSYISRGDYGVPVKLLAIAVDYMDELPSEGSEPLFDSDLQSYLLEYQRKNGLDPSGCFDFETICFALSVSQYSTDGIENFRTLFLTEAHVDKSVVDMTSVRRKRTFSMDKSADDGK